MTIQRAAKLFLHHVGEGGFDRDAPKTLFRTRAIEEMLAALPNPPQEEVRTTLWRLFPSGESNCWGVPAKAEKIMKHLQAGDYVLFLRSRQPGGELPVLCWVKYVFPLQSPALSTVLWGEDKYPLIFLFDTEVLCLGWEEFRLQMRYSERYDPRGCFVFVSSKALTETYGGVKNYIEFVRRHYSAGAIRHPAQEMQMTPLVGHQSGVFVSPPFVVQGEPMYNAREGSEETPSSRFLNSGLWAEGRGPGGSARAG